MALKTSFLTTVDNSSGLRLTISDLQILHLSDEPLSLLLDLLAQRTTMLNNENRLQFEVIIIIFSFLLLSVFSRFCAGFAFLVFALQVTRSSSSPSCRPATSMSFLTVSW